MFTRAIEAVRAEIAELLKLPANFRVFVLQNDPSVGPQNDGDINTLQISIGDENLKQGVADVLGVTFDPNTSPQNAFAPMLRANNVDKVRDTVTVAGGTITPDQGPNAGTELTFTGGELELSVDRDGDGTVQPGERGEWKIYVVQDGDKWVVKAVQAPQGGTTLQQAVNGAERAAPGADVEFYLIGTVGTDGIYTPNLRQGENVGGGRRPDLKWKIGDENDIGDNAENAVEEAHDHNAQAAQDAVLTRFHEYRKATDAEASSNDVATHHNDEIDLSSKRDGDGNLVAGQQTVTYTAVRSPNFEDTQGEKAKTLALMKITTVTRVHSDDFDGYEDVAIDRMHDDEGDAGARKFSYAASNAGDADNLVQQTTENAVAGQAIAVSFVAGGEDEDFGTEDDVDARTLRITLKAKASNAEIEAFLEGEVLRDALAELIDVTGLTITYGQGATGGERRRHHNHHHASRS